jgi:hypothetical protein
MTMCQVCGIFDCESGTSSSIVFSIDMRPEFVNYMVINTILLSILFATFLLYSAVTYFLQHLCIYIDCPCNSRLPFNDVVQNRRVVQQAFGKVYDFKVKKGQIGTIMSCFGWRIFVRENGLCTEGNQMIFSMVDTVWRITLVYVN